MILLVPLRVERATWLVLRVSRGGEFGDFGSCRRNKLAVGVGVAVQAPTTIWRLGEEHPRPVGNARITRGLGNEPREFRDHRELLVPVESAGVREHLHPDMRVAAIHIAQHAGGNLVHESCGVLPKHRNVRYLLDGHQRFGKLLSELEPSVIAEVVSHAVGFPPRCEWQQWAKAAAATLGGKLPLAAERFNDRQNHSTRYVTCDREQSRH